MEKRKSTFEQKPEIKKDFRLCPRPKCGGELYKFGDAGKYSWYQCKKCCRKCFL